VYERTFKIVSEKVNEIDHLEFVTETNEIAGVRRVDPLGITYLRVRGMWGIDTPHKVFGSMTDFSNKSDFSVFVLMLAEKYKSMPKKDRDEIESNASIKTTSVEIKSPNNPAEFLKAKLLSFKK
jgi:hypothetical protein